MEERSLLAGVLSGITDFLFRQYAYQAH